ncbi:MAG: hypothetical protein ACT4P6_00835 [Gemmatimonadaceae bacterium]
MRLTRRILAGKWARRQQLGLVFQDPTPLLVRQIARAVVGVTLTVTTVPAQGWDAPPALDLVRRAITRRSAQISDSALAGYQSRAMGRLLFLAQLGDTSLIPPRVVKADQIAVDVFWKAPAFSKQLIVGTRDTLLLPGDIGYYQDRYGIVQSNFPNLIRLGEGRDVRDVPHPLAPNATAMYEYALRDSLTITLPDRRIDVYEVAVRPRDPRAARVVGSLYLDRGSADIVRMSLTFTDAAILDRRIERLSVVLENALIEGRFWLPRRQELEVARAGTWLDLPVRGIIRGSWQICCYQINLAIDATVFSGAAIARAPFNRRRNFQWPEPLAEVLPSDIAGVPEEDVARVQEMAQRLITRAALARASSAALSARSLSDFVRYNRVEGLALGIGASRHWGGRWSVAGRVRTGLDDRATKGSARLGVVAGQFAAALFAEQDFRDVGDISEGSSLRNSLAAQEFGSDYTNPYGVFAVGGVLQTTALGWRWGFEGAYVRHHALDVHATPARGRFESTIPAWRLHGPRGELRGNRTATFAGGALRLLANLSGGDLEVREITDSIAQNSRFGRAVAELRYNRERADRMLRVSAFGAAAVSSGGSAVPPQALVYFGGPVSGPGYSFHAFRARRGAMLHAEYGVRVPVPSLPLARYGRSPANAQLLPFAHVIGVSGSAAQGTHADGLYPSLGIAVEFFFDLLRVETARGLRDGRWTFTMDLSEGFRAIF